jgi:hypothetical protein
MHPQPQIPHRPNNYGRIKKIRFLVYQKIKTEPDDFPIEFFQTYWLIIRDDLYHIIDAFYHNR